MRAIKPLKIGVLSQTAMVSHYMKDLVEWCKQAPDIEIKHCIIHSDHKTQNKNAPWLQRAFRSLRKNGIPKTVANLLFLLIQWIESRYLLRKPAFKNHFSRYKLADLGLIPIYTTPIISQSRLIHRFSEADIESIKNLNLDLLICFGGPILRGDILQACQYGVISLHHGNNDSYRGYPPGFWEIYEKNPVTGFVIQQLKEEVDNGAIFVKGLLNTKPYWLFNQAALYVQANYYFKAFLKELAQSKTLPEPKENHPYSHRLYTKPNVSQCLYYLLGLGGFYFRNKFKRGKWQVAFMHKNWDEAVLWRSIDFPKLPGIGLADPFLYRKDGKDYCFVEEIDMEIDRGSIAVYQIFEDHAQRLGTVLKEDFNLSYPYVFEYAGSVYMMPETFEVNDIRIYECVEFPLQWRLKKIVMSNLSAADSTLIANTEGWWLLTNLDHTSVLDHCTELSIYFADSPLSDQWTPHPKNPIYIDAFKSRNGGCFTLKGKTYRVCQSQGINAYGESLFINEIKELNHNHFRERRITHLTPDFKKNIRGIHHFHSNGHLTVFDYFQIK